MCLQQPGDTKSVSFPAGRDEGGMMSGDRQRHKQECASNTVSVAMRANYTHSPPGALTHGSGGEVVVVTGAMNGAILSIM